MSLYGADPREDWTPTTVAVVGLGILAAAVVACVGSGLITYAVARFVGDALVRRFTPAPTSRSSL